MAYSSNSSLKLYLCMLMLGLLLSACGSSGIGDSETDLAQNPTHDTEASEHYCIDPYQLAACVTSAREAGREALLLEQTYYLTESLLLESNDAIVGMGESSVITWDDSIKDSVNAPLLTSTWETPLNNLFLRNFALKCHIDQDPDSEDLRNDHMGLYLNGPGDPSSDEATVINNLTLERLTVSNCSHGIHVKGATGVLASDLNVHHNGNTEIDYYHNVYWRRVANLVVTQTDGTSNGYWGSPRGHGIRGAHLSNVYFENLAVYNNADHGVHLDTVYNMRLHNMHIDNNCQNPNGTCNAYKCFSSQCDIEWNAEKEDIYTLINS